MTCQVNGSTSGLCPQYSFNTSTNQISNTGYVYGGTGHLINDGTHTYQYDAEGRLISVDNGTTASYLYDALGQRVEKDVGGVYSEYVFNIQGEPVGVHNRTNWQEDYIPLGQGRHVAHYAAGAHFMHADALGTTGIVTSYTGAVEQDELHYPWGQEWTMMGSMKEERCAQLQHRDSVTSLDPTYFRMYASDQGRWMTPDPAGSCPLHPQNFDRYTYGGNNPTNRIDPHGDALYPIEYPYYNGFGFGYDQFDETPNYSPAIGLGCGLYGCGLRIPSGPQITCVLCYAACRERYAEALAVCAAGTLNSSILAGPIYGYIRGRQCADEAAQGYTACSRACALGPCNPENPIPALPF